MVKDRFDSVAKIAAIGAPLLILHGVRDGVVPVRFGRRLFEAAVEPKENRWFAEAGHNDLYSYGAATAVTAFIERVWAERPGRPAAVKAPPVAPQSGDFSGIRCQI